MKKNKILNSILLIIGCLFALASCDWFSEEGDGDDYIEVKGPTTVYVGSTARLYYSVNAPSYADYDYITIDVNSRNRRGVDTYFTESCAEDDDGWSEFVVEGIKKGKYQIELSVEEFELVKVVDITVVDKTSLLFDEDSISLERNDKQKLTVSNELNLPLKFSSTNEDVATVSSDGTVTALKSGRAQIIAESEDGYVTASCNVTVKSNLIADRYFWGEWISMYDGSRLVIKEKDVIYYDADDLEKKNGIALEIDKTSASEIEIINPSRSSSAASEVTGTYTKSSDNVMIFDIDNNILDATNEKNIPYFRNGGQNLSYTLQLVGFTKEEAKESGSRAVSTLNLSGLKVKGQSNTYTSYENEATSDQNGKVTLEAPVTGDVQTVTITSDEGSVIVVPDLKIENDGLSMGKIPVTGKGDYSLKVTGTINDEQAYEDDGYLYQGMDKSYTMEICITNVSEVKSGAGHIKIEAADKENLVVSPVKSGERLDSIVVPTLRPGASKKITVEISYTGTSDAPYVDTALNITITNDKTSASPERTWEDLVPVRFFQKKVPLYIYPQLIDDEGDEDSQLHLFVMYPDGSCLYDYLTDKEPGLLEVPSFGSEKPYYLALCGATADVLRGSSEMWYKVNLEGEEISEDDIHEKMKIDTNLSTGFGEGNDTEDTAYEVTDSVFQAAITDSDIDFWKFYIK